MEDEPMHKDSISFFDLIEKGLTDIMEYSEHQDIKKEALVVSDGRGVILHSNTEWEDLCGFTTEEIVGKTNKFLQGSLTDPATIANLDEKLRTGLPARASVINYRKSGKAFENVFTIIPVYDWLKDETDDSSHRSKASSLDYSGSDNSEYRQYSDLFMHPSHFVARLDHTPDLDYLPPLSQEELAKRDHKPSSDDDDDKKNSK